jgi:L-asparaginase/Glu-tRNA(Gln) amidotransferase subunit D
MHYTAAALSFMLQGLGVPVVLTGSVLPGSEPKTDAFANLEAAVRVAAESDIAEVCIVFSADAQGYRRVIIRGNRARKVNTRSFAAFESINVPPLGYIRNERISYTGLPRFHRARRDPVLTVGLETKVALIKQNPALTPAILRGFLHGLNGGIIEGTGDGRINERLLATIAQFGRPVGLSTQVARGGESLGKYELDRKILALRNIISLGDMTGETALVKLMWVLGQKLPVKSTMQKPICGEIRGQVPSGWIELEV